MATFQGVSVCVCVCCVCYCPVHTFTLVLVCDAMHSSINWFTPLHPVTTLRLRLNSLSLSHTHTHTHPHPHPHPHAHARTHARTYARTRTRTHTYPFLFFSCRETATRPSVRREQKGKGPCDYGCPERRSYLCITAPPWLKSHRPQALHCTDPLCWCADFALSSRHLCLALSLCLLNQRSHTWHCTGLGGCKRPCAARLALSLVGGLGSGGTCGPHRCTVRPPWLRNQRRQVGHLTAPR